VNGKDTPSHRHRTTRIYAYELHLENISFQLGGGKAGIDNGPLRAESCGNFSADE
jgi:hypothetical protein